MCPTFSKPKKKSKKESERVISNTTVGDDCTTAAVAFLLGLWSQTNGRAVGPWLDFMQKHTEILSVFVTTKVYRLWRTMLAWPM